MKKPVIRLIGIGGGGCNGVRNLSRYLLNRTGPEISSVLVNSDWSSIEGDIPTGIKSTIGIGEHTARRLGASSKPDVGYKCAIEDRDRLEELIRDAGLIFLRICLGGGTGSGAGLAIAEMAEKNGNLTVVGLITTPFNFEGKSIRNTAERYRHLIASRVDLMVCKSNDELRKRTRKDEPIPSMFEKMEQEFFHIIKGISIKYAELGYDPARLKRFLAIHDF